MLNFLVSQIYVPICTSELHWYLVVVDIDEGIVFQMNSFLQPGDLVPREMRNLWWSVSGIISVVYILLCWVITGSTHTLYGSFLRLRHYVSARCRAITKYHWQASDLILAVGQ